jgi:hypothetical protein
MRELNRAGFRIFVLLRRSRTREMSGLFDRNDPALVFAFTQTESLGTRIRRSTSFLIHFAIMATFFSTYISRSAHNLA